MGATLVERAPFHTLPSAYHWNLLESVAYPQIRLRKGRETKRKQQRERDKSSSSYSVPLPELKMDSWRNAAMAVSRDYACSPPSNTWDSFTLVGHNDSATNTRPPSGREEREGGELVGGGICHHTIRPKGRSDWRIMDHDLHSGEQRPTGFYCFITSATEKSRIIHSNRGSDLSSFWSMLDLTESQSSLLSQL